MRRVNISQFRQNIHKEIQELPIEIMSHGKTVAIVVKELDLTPEEENERVVNEDLGQELDEEEYNQKMSDKINEEGWKEIKTKEDVAKKIEIVGGYEVPKPFKMPHYFGGKQK